MAFIGRERELAILGASLQRAAGGEPTRVALSGPLGIGISRLIDEMIERLAGTPRLVICRARCYESRSGVAYSAVSAALAPALEALPDERLQSVLGSGAYDVAAVIAPVAERLAGLNATPAAPALEAPDQRGARVREAILGVIERLAEEGGQLLLVIEDLEHSDPATREFVGALLRLSRRIPVALVLGYHPDDVPRRDPVRRLLREIEDLDGIERVRLNALSREELAGLVESLTGERPTLGFTAAVMEGSRGNPLLAGQLVAAQQRLAGLRLSDPLGEIVEASLARLDAQQVRVLRLLAAARRPIPGSDLGAIRLADGHLPRNAGALMLETGLAIETAYGHEIVHELFAEQIETLTLPRERHAIHGALARLGGIAPAEAAWHWERAAQPTEARQAHLEAAAAAERIEPGHTALMHYAAALELMPDDPIDADLLAAAAVAADSAGAFRRAAALAEQAIEHVAGGRIERLLADRHDRPADRLTDRLRAGDLAEQLGRYRRSSGDPIGARTAFEQAVELIPEGQPAARAHAVASLAQDLMLEGRFADSARLATEARAAAAAGGEPALADLAHATDTLGVDLGYLGEIDRGLAMIDEALSAARRAGRLDEVMRCYANRTTLLDLDSRREQALAVVKEGIDEARRNSLGLTYGAFLRGNAADILFQLGRWEESEAECRAALEFPPAGVAWFSPILYLGLVLVETRADDEAARLVGRTLLQLETVPAGQWSSLVVRTAVSLALWRGDLEDALNAAGQGWERVLETDDAGQIASASATILEACAASAERGRLRRDWSSVADAGALAGRVLPIAEERVARHELPLTVGARRETELYLDTARAHATRVRGRSKPETWAALAEAWSKVPVPYQVAKARWWQAQAALTTRSRRPEARRALLEAWRISGELPARPLRRALRDLADRARITLPDQDLVAIPIVADTERELVPVGPGRAPARGARPSPGIADRVAGVTPDGGALPFGLSPRENSVLLVLAEGRTNREIAERLFISERTVAVHVRRILAKLGVSGRVEATGLAIRLGLVPNDPKATIDRRAAVAAGPSA
jgi:DNA-binding CsgD family transcriptional regulator/tetratricopeptide (TPR) repeat protein